MSTPPPPLPKGGIPPLPQGSQGEIPKAKPAMKDVFAELAKKAAEAEKRRASVADTKDVTVEVKPLECTVILESSNDLGELENCVETIDAQIRQLGKTSSLSNLSVIANLKSLKVQIRAKYVILEGILQRKKFLATQSGKLALFEEVFQELRQICSKRMEDIPQVFLDESKLRAERQFLNQFVEVRDGEFELTPDAHASTTAADFYASRGLLKNGVVNVECRDNETERTRILAERKKAEKIEEEKREAEIKNQENKKRIEAVKKDWSRLGSTDKERIDTLFKEIWTDNIATRILPGQKKKLDKSPQEGETQKQFEKRVKSGIYKIIQAAATARWNAIIPPDIAMDVTGYSAREAPFWPKLETPEGYNGVTLNAVLPGWKEFSTFASIEEAEAAYNDCKDKLKGGQGSGEEQSDGVLSKYTQWCNGLTVSEYEHLTAADIDCKADILELGAYLTLDLPEMDTFFNPDKVEIPSSLPRSRDGRLATLNQEYLDLKWLIKAVAQRDLGYTEEQLEVYTTFTDFKKLVVESRTLLSEAEDTLDVDQFITAGNMKDAVHLSFTQVITKVTGLLKIYITKLQTDAGTLENTDRWDAVQTALDKVVPLGGVIPTQYIKVYHLEEYYRDLKAAKDEKVQAVYDEAVERLRTLQQPETPIVAETTAETCPLPAVTKSVKQLSEMIIEMTQMTLQADRLMRQLCSPIGVNLTKLKNELEWDLYMASQTMTQAALGDCLTTVTRDGVSAAAAEACVEQTHFEFTSFRGWTLQIVEKLTERCGLEATKSKPSVVTEGQPCSDNIPEDLQEWMATDPAPGKMFLCYKEKVPVKVGDSVGIFGDVYAVSGNVAGVAPAVDNVNLFQRIIRGSVAGVKSLLVGVWQSITALSKLVSCGMTSMLGKLWYWKLAAVGILLIMLSQNLFSVSTVTQYVSDYGLQAVVLIIQLLRNMCSLRSNVTLMSSFLYIVLAQRVKRLPGKLGKLGKAVVSSAFVRIMVPVMMVLCVIMNVVPGSVFDKIGDGNIQANFSELGTYLSSFGEVSSQVPAGGVLTNLTNLTETAAPANVTQTVIDSLSAVSTPDIMSSQQVATQAHDLVTLVQTYFDAFMGNVGGVSAGLQMLGSGISKIAANNIQQFAPVVYTSLQSGVSWEGVLSTQLSALQEVGVTTVTAAVGGTVASILAADLGMKWLTEGKVDTAPDVDTTPEDKKVTFASDVEIMTVKPVPSFLPELKRLIMATGCPIPEVLQGPIDSWNNDAVRAISEIIDCENAKVASIGSVQLTIEQQSMLQAARIAIDCNAKGQLVDLKTGRCMAVVTPAGKAVAVPASIPVDVLPVQGNSIPAAVRAASGAQYVGIVDSAIRKTLESSRLVKVIRKMPAVKRMTWINRENRKAGDKLLDSRGNRIHVMRTYPSRRVVVNVLADNYDAKRDILLV